MKVVDIEALGKVVHKSGDIIFAVDNTFLTSYFQRPLELGADLVCYSLTKYMNGHTDVVMGAVTMNSEVLYNRLKFLQNGIVFLANKICEACRQRQYWYKKKNNLTITLFLFCLLYLFV